MPVRTWKNGLENGLRPLRLSSGTLWTLWIRLSFFDHRQKKIFQWSNFIFRFINLGCSNDFRKKKNIEKKDAGRQKLKKTIFKNFKQNYLLNCILYEIIMKFFFENMVAEGTVAKQHRRNIVHAIIFCLIYQYTEIYFKLYVCIYVYIVIYVEATYM